MASSKMVERLVYFVVVCMVVFMLRTTPPYAAEAAVTCGGVVKSLNPCMTYLKTSGSPGTPPGPCCDGVRNLKSTAQTPADRKTACTCLKNMAAKMKGLNMVAARRLPVQCGVSIRYAISPSTNCDTVQ